MERGVSVYYSIPCDLKVKFKCIHIQKCFGSTNTIFINFLEYKLFLCNVNKLYMLELF